MAAIAKNEGIYFPQWIFHHYKFGIKDFEIWINQSNDESIKILKQLNLHPDINIRIFDADDVYKECQIKGKNFQQEAYNIILRDSLVENFDYLFFLDIDEFWTPKNLTTSLQSYLSRFPDADAISFRWAFDAITQDQSIMKLPGHADKVQLNNHVKTILKLSQRIFRVNIHNSVIHNGIYLLEDGVNFLEENSRESRSIISGSLENLKLPDHFIFHAAYRSENEYISRLLRGRGHANDFRIIKVNRAGYLPEPNSKTMDWEIEDESRREYLENYLSFIEECSVGGFLHQTDYVNSEVEKFIDLICENKELIAQHYIQLRGINFQAISSNFGVTDTIKFAIDLVQRTSGNGVKIVGWCYDWFYRKLDIEAHIKVSGTKLTNISLVRHKRPDVLKVYRDAPLECGFTLNVPAGEIAHLKDMQLILFNAFNSVVVEIDVKPKPILSIMSHESYLRGSDLFRDLELSNLKGMITTIFDVGANTGQSCKEYLKHWHSATVFCFEPSPNDFKVLSEKFGGKHQVKLFELGISDQCATMTLIQEDISVNNHFIDSLAEAEDTEMVNCEVVTGDCFTSKNKIGGIDFLKIDTEGHDLRVLKGFHNYLSAGKIGLIQCEVSMSLANQKHVFFDEILNFIKPFGFEIFGFYEQVRTPGREFLRRANLVLLNYDYFQRTFPKLV